MSTLKSLALLKAHWETQRDYIDNFVPFVAECLRTATIEVVAIPELQRAVVDRFGIQIPQGALKTILKRARRHGYIEVDPAERVYRAIPERLASLGLDQLQARVEEEYNTFLRNFMAFAAAEYKAVIELEKAEALFIGFLNRHALPILEAAITGTPVPVMAPPSAKDEYILGVFIQKSQQANGPAFAFLETVVKGHVLASVLLYPNIGEVARTFNGVAVFFDTALLLRALGYSSDALKAPCVELLQLLSELGAECKCFAHTLDEVESVLDSVHWLLKDPRRLRDGRGDVLQHFLDCNATASDVNLEIATLPVRLRGIGIKIQDAPPHTRELGLDEECLETMLQDAVHYRKDSARKLDLDSLTAIHRLRHGRFPSRLEACGAIFVTTNHPLARASSDYFRLERDRGTTGAVVPHCVLDETLTTLVWLKSPQRMPDLPMKRVLADCYAAVNPSTALWKRYLEEIDKLQERGVVSADEYALLRFSAEARSLLMDRTLGEVEGFGEGTVQEVLRVARKNLQADANARAEAGENRAKMAEGALDQARQQAEAERQAAHGRISLFADGIARICGIAIFTLAAAILVVGGGLLQPWSGASAKGGWFGTIFGAAALIAAVFGLWSSITGGSVSSLRGTTQRRVSAWIVRKLTADQGR